MSILVLIAWFFGGAFVCNALPHTLAGVQGRRFQTPFASPPGVGLSPSPLNVVWGTINLAIGWVLLSQVGDFAIGRLADAGTAFAGFVVMGLLLARTFGKLHGGIARDK